MGKREREKKIVDLKNPNLKKKMEIKPNNVETLSYLKNIYCRTRRKLLRSIQKQR